MIAGKVDVRDFGLIWILICAKTSSEISAACILSAPQIPAVAFEPFSEAQGCDPALSW